MAHQRKSFFLLCLFFLSVQCSKRIETSLPIDHQIFVNLYIELLLASSTESVPLQQDTVLIMRNKQKVQEILKRYSISEEKFRSTLHAYNQDPVRWRRFYQDVLEGLQKLRTKDK